jgi:pimeloyl-ACP methyl ester carboxylesterase
VFFDMFDALSATVPPIVNALRRARLDKLVNALAALRAQRDPGVRWGLANARWTLGADGLTAMLDTAKAYTLAGVAQHITQDVLILAGADDQFIPLRQVERYQRALVNARSVTTRIYDRPSGGHEHSQLGATTLWQADFFEWLEQRFS